MIGHALYKLQRTMVRVNFDRGGPKVYAERSHRKNQAKGFLLNGGIASLMLVQFTAVIADWMFDAINLLKEGGTDSQI